MTCKLIILWTLSKLAKVFLRKYFTVCVKSVLAPFAPTSHCRFSLLKTGEKMFIFCASFLLHKTWETLIPIYLVFLLIYEWKFSCSFTIKVWIMDKKSPIALSWYLKGFWEGLHWVTKKRKLRIIMHIYGLMLHSCLEG